MGKLKKARPILHPNKSLLTACTPGTMSKTMELATLGITQSPARQQTTAVPQMLTASATLASSREHYWAARALTAETLLSAREDHYRELRTLLSEEEAKRAREVAALTHQHNAKHTGMERLVILLLTALFVLVSLVIYLITHYTHQSVQKSRWSLPSHFTIPILSPFTSVIEHETSVIGSRTIVMVFAIVAGLAYLIFRQHISRFITSRAQGIRG